MRLGCGEGCQGADGGGGGALPELGRGRKSSWAKARGRHVVEAGICPSHVTALNDNGSRECPPSQRPCTAAHTSPLGLGGPAAGTGTAGEPGGRGCRAGTGRKEHPQRSEGITCVCECLHVCTRVPACVCTCTCVCLHMCGHVHECLHVCMHMYTSVFACVSMHASVCTCV